MGNKKRSSLRMVFCAVSIALVMSLVVVFVIGQYSRSRYQVLLNQNLAIEKLEGIFSKMKDAETGMRGYVITDSEDFLEPYSEAILTINDDIATVDELSSRGEWSPEDMHHIQELVQTRMQEITGAVNVRRDSGFDAAKTLLLRRHGKQTMDKLRLKIKALKTAKKTEIARTERLMERAIGLRSIVWVGAILLNLQFLAWAYRRLSREVRERDAAFTEEARQRELVAVTLSSIGDAVIVTDKNGLVTFMNPGCWTTKI